MEGTASSKEEEIILEEEKEGEVTKVYDERLREKPAYQLAKSFWNSPAGKQAIKKARHKTI